MFKVTIKTPERRHFWQYKAHLHFECIQKDVFRKRSGMLLKKVTKSKIGRKDFNLTEK